MQFPHLFFTTPLEFGLFALTTYLGCINTKQIKKCVCGGLQTVWQVGIAFSGHIKENPLAEITQSIFKQPQDQAGGRGRAWPGKVGPKQAKLTINSAVAYFGLPNVPENCPENWAWEMMVEIRCLHSRVSLESSRTQRSF